MFIFSLMIILYLLTKIPLEIFVNYTNFLINEKQTIIYLTLLFSIIGLNFMIIALYFRQKNIFSSISRENSFIVDNKEYDVPCVFQIWERKEHERITI